MGGPQPPGPNATEEEKKSYEGKRKAFTDANCCKLLAALSSVDMNVSPQKQVVTDYTGDQFSHIRLMTAVKNSPLMTGHTFAEKDIMMIRIGEEANLCNIRVKVVKSCKMQYEVSGDSFYVKVSNLMFQGWTICSLCCRGNDDTLIIPTHAMYISEKSLRSPLAGEWLGHLLRSHLEICPGMSYVHMRGLLANHVHTELISDNLLQEARDWAKLQLFGNADNNVQYCKAVKAAIIGMGHLCEFLCCDRRDVIHQLSATVVWEELKQREDKKEPALDRGAQMKELIKNWLIENNVPLTTQLGMHDGPPLKFLTGVFIATSTSKKQVPFVQDVILQADGAHMSFGKYTLFSVYANSVNGAMVSLGFAILFGNEDTSNWIKFWKFIKFIYPIVNQPTKTVITNQDKGSLASIRQIVPETGLFHCAFHRWQNIKKKFGGGEGNTPLTCLLMVNILVKCNSIGSIRFLKNKYLGLMKPAHAAYLESLQDNQQFPGAHCNKSHDNMPTVYMYGLTSSSGVESMNRANDQARGKNAVDPLNAALVILKKEGHRFLRGQSDAHKVSRFSNCLLTPKGIAITEEIFAKCDPSIYRMQMTDLLDSHKFVISKKSTATREYIVVLQKMPLDHGSKFGSCTCGFPFPAITWWP